MPDWFIYRIVLIMLAFPYSCGLQGQQEKFHRPEIDSLTAKARETDRRDPGEMIRLAEQALLMVNRTEDEQTTAGIYEIIGLANYYLINFDIAVDNILLAISLYESTGDDPGIARNFNNLALIYKDIGDTTNALVYNNKALELFRKAGDRAGEANTLNALGSIYLIRDIGKAHEYYQASYEIRKELGDPSGIASSMNNLGIIFQSRNNIDSAIALYKKALEINKQLGNKQFMAVALNNIALLEEDISGPEKKIEYLLEALELSLEAGYGRGVVYTLSSLAQHYYSANDYTRSLDYLDQALKVCHEEQQDDFRLRIYNYYSELYSKMGDFEKAFYYMTRYSSLKDSVRIDTRSRISRLQLRYLSEKNEREAQLKEMEVKRERSRKVFYLVSAILVAVIAALIFSRYLIKNRNARLLKQKNLQLEEINRMLTASEKKLSDLNATKDKFFSIIAHDLKNPLGTMRSILDFFRENFGSFSATQQQEYLDMLDTSMKSTYSLLQNLLQWAMSQSGKMEVKKEVFDIHDITGSTCKSILPLATEKEISLKNLIPPGLWVLADRNMIETVVRNLVVNAIKFSYPGKAVVVNAVKGEGKVMVSVSDEGVGMSENDLAKLFRIDTDTRGIGSESPDAERFSKHKGTGLGLILCREFVMKNGGDIDVESAPGKGTVFRFTLIPAENQ